MGFLEKLVKPFEGKPETLEAREPKTSEEARLQIQKIAQTKAQVPGQQIAGFSQLEQQAIDLAGEFLRDPSGEISIDKAIAVATQIAEQKIDINSPEIQAVIKEVRKSGDEALNRVGRQLQKQGTLSTSQGRDVTGRLIGDIESSTVAALAPLLSDFRSQRLQATSLLPNLVGQKAGITVSRIATGQQAGALITDLQQRIKNAVFNRKLQQFEFETTGKADIASLLLQNPTQVVLPGEQGILGRFANVGADLAAAGSFGATRAVESSTSTQPQGQRIAGGGGAVTTGGTGKGKAVATGAVAGGASGGPFGAILGALGGLFGGQKTTPGGAKIVNTPQTAVPKLTI